MRRSARYWFSTETPTHALKGQRNPEANFISRSGRLVRTLKVWRSAATMTSKPLAMKESGTSSWKGSGMLLTKMRRGRRQESG